MSHTVPVSDDLYEKIAAYAAERQQQPDALIEVWLTDAMRRASESAAVGEQAVNARSDPLFQVAGIFATGEPGWGRRHDELLVSETVAGQADLRCRCSMET
jgi:hypothetical protein